MVIQDPQVPQKPRAYMPRLNLKESAVLSPAIRRLVWVAHGCERLALLEEIGTLVTKRGTRENLNSPANNGDFGSSQIGTLEAIKEGYTRLILQLMLIGTDHHGNSLGRVCRIAFSR